MEQVDILMATYNGGKYIREQIESILNQTYSNIRLIISDDCSKDNTVSILKEFEMKDSRIKVYYQKENIGTTRNFEFLLTKVENDIYGLSDQDDIWLPNKIEKNVECISKNKCDLVFSDLALINSEGKIISKSFWKEKKMSKKIKNDKEYKGLLLNNYVTGCTIFAKKKFIKNILPIPRDTTYLLHDYWIAIVTSLNGKIDYIDKPYTLYRQHEDNQVGYKMKSRNMSNLDEIRRLFINVKVEHFIIFNDRKSLFSDKQQQMNKRSLEYFEMLKEKKNVNFRQWFLFYKLYKYEGIKYFIANFVILNIPFIGRIIFRGRKKYGL